MSEAIRVDATANKAAEEAEAEAAEFPLPQLITEITGFGQRAGKNAKIECLGFLGQGKRRRRQILIELCLALRKVSSVTNCGKSVKIGNWILAGMVESLVTCEVRGNHPRSACPSRPFGTGSAPLVTVSFLGCP